MRTHTYVELGLREVAREKSAAEAPYICPMCNHGFSGPYVRCIGEPEEPHTRMWPILNKRRTYLDIFDDATGRSFKVRR